MGYLDNLIVNSDTDGGRKPPAPAASGCPESPVSA
jgi:hypothetical protein